MTYEEFADAVSAYMTAPMTGNHRFFSAVFAIIFILLFIRFCFYLYQEYKRKKASVETFEHPSAGGVEYPGFHPGGAPRKETVELKDEKKEKRGGINDEY